jgi:VIT1/CCC1 family predicted Fe2+/Mn2+ transporter
MQAAITSAASYAAGAVVPLLLAAFGPGAGLIPIVSGSSLLLLALLGGLAAQAGGASIGTGALRVTFWGALAMSITAGAGALFGQFA